MKEYIIPIDRLIEVKRLFYGEIFTRIDEEDRALICCYAKQVRQIEMYLKFKPKINTHNQLNLNK